MLLCAFLAAILHLFLLWGAGFDPQRHEQISLQIVPGRFPDRVKTLRHLRINSDADRGE
jgi:hypothetical protein